MKFRLSIRSGSNRTPKQPSTEGVDLANPATEHRKQALGRQLYFCACIPSLQGTTVSFLDNRPSLSGLSLPGVSMARKEWGHYPKKAVNGPIWRDSRYIVSLSPSQTGATEPRSCPIPCLNRQHRLQSRTARAEVRKGNSAGPPMKTEN